MGKILKKIKGILYTNITKNIKKLVARFGKFLIAISQLSIAVIFWATQLYISEPIIATFLFAGYVAAVELSTGAIVDVFKNGNGNGYTVPPQ